MRWSAGRWVLHVALVLTLLLATRPTAAQGEYSWVADVIVDRAIARGVSPHLLLRVALCETGGTLYPWSVGAQGELGIFQLHPRGELRTFYARGYGSPFNVWESADFSAARFAEGGARAWSCY